MLTGILKSKIQLKLNSVSMDKLKTHHYIHKGVRYDNQKEVCTKLGITSRAFRFKVKAKEIIKHNNSQNRHYEQAVIQH